MRCKVPASTTRADVDEERSGGVSVRPKARRHIGMKEKSPNAVIESAKDALSMTVLL